MDWARGFDGEIVTTQWVLTEVADAFARSRIWRRVCRTLKELAGDASTRIIEVSPAHFTRGMALYDERPDKAWSLTDGISFVVMTDEGLTERASPKA